MAVHALHALHAEVGKPEAFIDSDVNGALS
jgi:hypothetical protein